MKKFIWKKLDEISEANDYEIGYKKLLRFMDFLMSQYGVSNDLKTLRGKFLGHYNLLKEQYPDTKLEFGSVTYTTFNMDAYFLSHVLIKILK